MIIPFDAMFPVKGAPSPQDRVFGFDADGNVNAAFSLQAIISLLENSNPTWEQVENKPTSFPPAAHTLGSHSNVADGADSATEGQLLRRQGTNWTPWTPNFLTSFTESDPTVPTWVKAILAQQIANWDQAHSWGNHAGQYRPINWVPTWGQVTDKPTAFPPSAHTLGSHSNVAANADSATEGQLLRRQGNQWVNWTPNFLDASYNPPPDPTIPDFVRNITIAQISNWDQKSIEFADINNEFPLIISGVAVPSGFRAILDENPFDQYTQEEDWANWEPTVQGFETDLPIVFTGESQGDQLTTKAEVKAITGFRSNLNTQNKDNLVQAVNEANTWTQIEW